MSRSADVLIIGAGLAGLCCARRLAEDGISFQIIEASDGIGGRVRTDEVDGFLLDRGFQVLLTAYPEARRILDYSKLDLKSFSPGTFSPSALPNAEACSISEFSSAPNNSTRPDR